MEKGLWRAGDSRVRITSHLHLVPSLGLQLIRLSPSNFDFQEKAEVDKYYPQYYHKMDKVRLTASSLPQDILTNITLCAQDGRPVYIEQLGKLDITALNAITTQERQLKRLVWEYEKFVNERLPACSKAVGHPVETSCTILDLKGVKILKAWSFKEYIQKAAEIGQNRYPETMGKFYIINAPFGFESLWSWIKPWLDPVTVEKIAILSRDSKDKLLAQIPPENLPKDLGGSCSCPGGCSLADSGPWQQQAQQ